MELIVTLHARQRMDFYGITESQVREVIQRGAKTPQTDGLLAVHTYIRVAYKVHGNKYIVKTVMVDRF